MSTERTLPKKRNPLLAPERTPDRRQPYPSCVVTIRLTCFVDAELVSIRRLGQTDLSVKPGQVGTSNATKPENLGIFDYAHLRAPLPENLKSSEIFAPIPGKPNPGAYFLMVCCETTPRFQCDPLTMGTANSGGAVMAISVLRACSKSASHGRSTRKSWRNANT
jgi:hypothetical protein